MTLRITDEMSTRALGEKTGRSPIGCVSEDRAFSPFHSALPDPPPRALRITDQMSTWIDVPDDLVDLVDDMASELDCTREEMIRIALAMAKRWPLVWAAVLEELRKCA